MLSLGIAAVVTIFVALLVALTLMPAMLSDNLSRWHVPWLRNHNIAISGGLDGVEGLYAAYETVSAEDVRAAARHYLNPDRRVVAVLRENE